MISPISSDTMFNLSDNSKGKYIHLNLDGTISQLTAESAPRSDCIGSHHLAISMEKNHCLVMKIKQIDDEQNLQFQWDKMQYENMNA